MELIKSVFGGVIVKTARLTVFLEMKDYLELVNEARANNITAKNDSELIRKIISIFINDFPMLRLQIDQLQKANIQKKAIIETLERTLQELNLKKVVVDVPVKGKK